MKHLAALLALLASPVAAEGLEDFATGLARGEPGYGYIRCAGFYSAVLQRGGGVLDAAAEAQITGFATDTLRAAVAEAGRPATASPTVMDEVIGYQALYDAVMGVNFEATGRAISGDPVLEADNRLCRDIAEKAAAQ